MTDPIRVTVHLLAFTAADPDTYVAKRHDDEAPTSFTFTLPDDFPRHPEPEQAAEVEALAVAEGLFMSTNAQAGRLWSLVSGRYPADASHTSISPGDLIVVNGVYVRCEPVGWSILSPSR